MTNTILLKLANKEQLTHSEIDCFVKEIATNNIQPAILGGFILGLTAKGVDTKELKYLAKSISEYALIENDLYENAITCSGTGGDLQNTFNLTTASSVVASACNIGIIKNVQFYSNSKSSSAKFVNELGVHVCESELDIQTQFQKNNIAFVNNDAFNMPEKVINQTCQEMKINSIFNIVNSIVHPILTNKIFVGIAYPELAESVIEVISDLGYKQAIVVNAQNPLLDEISICSETTVLELNDGEIEKYEITPDCFGIKRSDVLALRGATPKYNANLILDIFKGNLKDSKLDAIAMNAGMIIYLAGNARNHLEGIMKAYTIIDNGLALQKIKDLSIKL